MVRKKGSNFTKGVEIKAAIILRSNILRRKRPIVFFCRLQRILDRPNSGIWTKRAGCEQMEAARSLVFIGAVLLGVPGVLGGEGG